MAPTAPTAARTANLTALVVEGGAMRGVFALGVLRSCLDGGFFPFDFCIGVSSGAFALALALLDRTDLALQAFTEWAVQGDFVSFTRFARGGHLMDLDALSAQLENELGELGISPWRVPLYVCVTDVESGGPRYVEAGPDNLIPLLRATTAMPWLYRGFPSVSGRACTDGGASDAIPVARAIALGASRIAVVRSRPREYVKRDTLGHRLVRWNLRQHPALCAAMRGRAERFQKVVSLMRSPPEGVAIVEICPPKDFAMGRFGRDPSTLLQGYEAGLAAGRAAMLRWPG